MMNRRFRTGMLRLVTTVGVFALFALRFAEASHFDHQPPPPPPVAPPPVIVRPPPQPVVVPSRPVVPPPVKAAVPTPEQRIEIERHQTQIAMIEKNIQTRKAEIAQLEEELTDKEYTISTLNERIDMFSKERDGLLKERDGIREDQESYRVKLTDNEFFMKLGINMRTAAIPGHPVTVGLVDYWVGWLDKEIKVLPESMEYRQREYIDPVRAKLQAWIEWANTQPASQREAQLEWGKRKYEPLLASYENSMQSIRDRLSDCMAAKDQLLSMRPTLSGAEDRIRQIELRANELDRLINDDVAHRNSTSGKPGSRGIDFVRQEKERLERSLVSLTEWRNSEAAALNTLIATAGGSNSAIAGIELVAAPATETKVEVEPPPQKTEAELPPTPIQEASKIADKRVQIQQDVEYHLQNRDRAQAELRSIQQRAGTEEQQANLRARIAASEEFALAAGRELTRLGGAVTDYVRQDLSDYDPYKLTQTDRNLMELSARQRAENEATDQIIKTRQFISNTTDQADAIDLIQKLERVAGFNNQGGLRDFERLDAVREFRATVYETRTQATFAQESLEATLADLDYTAYAIGADRVKTGATLTVALGTGAVGMAAMAGSAGLVTLSAGTGAALTAQAAAAGKVLLVYNISTGSITGYSENGLKGTLEGAAKELLPVNTYIAIRDSKGAGTIAVGIWQDAGNVLQIYSFAKSLNSAVQATAAANVESGLKGSEAAFNRAWKLDQAQTDFLSTQMSAQATVLNLVVEDPVKARATGSGAAPQQIPAAKPAAFVGQATASAQGDAKLPLGDAWNTKAAGVARFGAGEGIAGLEKLGLSGATVEAFLPPGLGGGATMDEVKSAGRELVRSFDTQVLPVLGAGKLGSTATTDGTALALTPKLERQLEILRGMSDGHYSAIVADKMLSRETGQCLAEAMARLSGIVKFVYKP